MSRTKAAEARRRLDESRTELKAKVAVGLPTTQVERREPWYWELFADEAEWSALEADREIAFHEARIGYHNRMRLAFEHGASRPWQLVSVEPPPAEEYQPLAPFQPRPPPP